MALLFKLRVALYTTILLLVSFIAVIEGLILTLVGKRLNTNYYVARTFYYIAGPIMGWKFEVEGEEHLWNLDIGGEGVQGHATRQGRSAVMLGNHQSFVDILWLGRIFPKRAAIMAKESIKWIPGLGWFMLMSGTVFINRGNHKSAIASMTHAGEDMKRKRISLWIFPEGTRHLSAQSDLLPFKKGAFYLAVQAGTPIVPVVIQNYHHLFDGKTRFRSGTVKIKVLPPIPTSDLTTADVPALIEKTRDLMLKTLQELDTPLDKIPSPTPLLAGGTGTNYDAISSSAPLEGAVAGSTSDDSASISTKSIEVEHDETTTTPTLSKTSRTTRSQGAGSNGKGSKKKGAKKSIAMVSDFFLPVVGGVEGHIYSLGIEMVKRGHKVIVITHHHGDRLGVRYLSGLKVYHLPVLPIASNATLPNYLLFLPYFRDIVKRERIDIVHAHGSLSSLGQEALYHGPLFGIKTMFTDHSLFGFGDAVGVLTNKLLAGALRNVDAAICVSNTGRENTVLRGQIEPERVYVIPNALVADSFKPSPKLVPSDTVTIVIMSRLVYRKGIDLLVASAPHICDLYPQVRFVVGGDGPKMVELEQMREKYQLQDRIELLGPVTPADVSHVLARGQIYLNTSLTEAFGISIIEAAAAGLFVVATKVGGVPEILPGDMIEFCRADEDDVVRALSHAIQVVQSGAHDPVKAHERVRGMYAWSDVAERTEKVYDAVLAMEHKDTFERLSQLLSLGVFYGPILCCIVAVQHWFLFVIEWLWPDDEIEMVESSWTSEAFEEEVAREKAQEGKKAQAGVMSEVV